MAPTELLAEQHANNFRQWFAPLGIEVAGWRQTERKARQAQQEAIASGQVQMIVGTHAIFQEQVQFNGLALVIIDEQHRFGVHQRLALGKRPAAGLPSPSADHDRHPDSTNPGDDRLRRS
jgi:ATP-dependent DNA helicase RecG